MRSGECIDCGAQFGHTPITGRVPLRCPEHTQQETTRRQREYMSQFNPTVQRDRNLKTKYGITLEQWNKLWAEQGEVCAICGTDTPTNNRGWATDHDHETGAVRGILCFSCNTGLGSFADSPEVLLKAVAYLQGRW